MNKITRPGWYSVRNIICDKGTGRPTKLSAIGCDAHTKRGVCPARGRSCLRCGGSTCNHFVRVCPSKKPNRFCISKKVRTLEAGPEPKESSPEEDSEAAEEVYQVTEGKSQNPIVALEVNTIPIQMSLSSLKNISSL